MKRLMSLLLMLCLLIPCLTAPALADTPKPIPTIDYDSIPEPREGLHHYLLLCSDQWTNKLVNTDGIVIVTLDTVTHRIMLTSIIRDALVERPDRRDWAHQLHRAQFRAGSAVQGYQPAPGHQN